MSYVTKRIRLLVPSNKAKPSPSIGQALGSLGINMMKFCKEFNATTTKYQDVSDRGERGEGDRGGERRMRGGDRNRQ